MQNCLQHCPCSFSHEDQYTYTENVKNAIVKFYNTVSTVQIRYHIKLKLYINLMKIMFYTWKLKNEKNWLLLLLHWNVKNL